MRTRTASDPCQDCPDLGLRRDFTHLGLVRYCYKHRRAIPLEPSMLPWTPVEEGCPLEEEEHYWPAERWVSWLLSNVRPYVSTRTFETLLRCKPPAAMTGWDYLYTLASGTCRKKGVGRTCRRELRYLTHLQWRGEDDMKKNSTVQRALDKSYRSQRLSLRERWALRRWQIGCSGAWAWAVRAAFTWALMFGIGLGLTRIISPLLAGMVAVAVALTLWAWWLS